MNNSWIESHDSAQDKTINGYVAGEGSNERANTEDNKKSDIIVGIPAYNEEVAIGSVILSVKRVTRNVLVADDGSTDATAELARKAGARVVSHETNRGKGATIRTIIDEVQDSDFEALVLMDGDGQHFAEDIQSVASPILNDDADIVIGSRYLENNGDETPLYRRLGQKTLDVLTVGSAGTSVTDSQSGFRAFAPEVARNITIHTDGMGVESEMIGQATNNGYDIEEVLIDVKYDGVEGQTYNPLRHGLTVMVFLLQLIRDRHPLIFFGLPGILLIGIGGLFIMSAILLNRSMSALNQWQILIGGYLTLIGMLSLFSGLILNQVANMVKKVRDIKP